MKRDHPVGRLLFDKKNKLEEKDTIHFPTGMESNDSNFRVLDTTIRLKVIQGREH